MTTTHHATAADVAAALGYLDQRATVRQARRYLFDIDTPPADSLRRMLTDVHDQDGLTVAQVRDALLDDADADARDALAAVSA